VTLTYPFSRRQILHLYTLPSSLSPDPIAYPGDVLSGFGPAGGTEKEELALVSDCTPVMNSPLPILSHSLREKGITDDMSESSASLSLAECEWSRLIGHSHFGFLLDGFVRGCVGPPHGGGESEDAKC
jgi:hypothetical protein